MACFQACYCKDYARVDIRIDSRNPYVLEINSMASLGGGGSYVMAALAAGYARRYAASATELNGGLVGQTIHSSPAGL